MAGPVAQVAPHGTYKRYKQGCREACCRAAAAAYVKDYRARKRGLKPVVTGAPRQGRPVQRATVTALNPPTLTPAPPAEVVEPLGPGPAERAVLEDTAELSTAQANKALVEAALAMARILDDRRQITTQPSAAAKLESLMVTLRRGAEQRKGRLARVQSMSTRGEVG